MVARLSNAKKQTRRTGEPADDYLRLVDWTGRQVRSDKRGTIPGQLPPILNRLSLSHETWFDTVTRFPRWLRRATKRPHLAL